MNEIVDKETGEITQQNRRPVRAIYKAMAGIMRDTIAISKDRLNKQQGWKFRGVDDVYNSFHPILAKHNVFMTTEILDMKREERPAKSGGSLIFTTLLVKFGFVSGEDGSVIYCAVPGEGMDSGDKSVNKALSNAHKYNLFQTFLTPTLDVEADSETPEAQNNRKAMLAQPKKINSQEYQALKQEIEECGLSVDYITRYVRKNLQIDSLENLPVTLLKPLLEKFPGMVKAKEESLKKQQAQQKETASEAAH